MIHEVDAALRALLRRDAVNGDVEVAFDAPTREWASKRTGPAINAYLYDIREDIGRRRVELEPIHDQGGVVIGRRRPPRRYRLSYLMTAWTQRPEDEHRLLSAILDTFLPHDALPVELVDGDGDSPAPTIYCTIGIPPPAERSIGEIWSAMGGELKPSLDLVLSVPFVLDEHRHAGPPVLEEPRLRVEDRERADPARRTRARAAHVDGGRPRPRHEVPADRDTEQRTDGAEETITGGRDDTGRILTITTIDR